MKNRKPFEGRNESEVFAEFMENPYWKHSRSEEGWWRIFNWMTDLALTIEYDQSGTITKHYWDR